MKVVCKPMKLQWTQTAFDSLAEIRSALGREKSPAKARQWLDSVFATANQLLDFPHLGASLGGEGGPREVAVGGYRMVYRVDGAEIIILTFKAGAGTEGGDDLPGA
jgi:plasmid stabilization system protein ParE